MRWFKPMAAALAVCILAGCAPASSSPQPEASGAPVQAAGRYVETDITPDGAQEMSTLLLQANGDTLDFAGMEREAPYAVHHWRSTDGGDSWTEQPVAWSGQIYPMLCAAAADGTLYVYGEATGGGEPDGQGEKALWRAAPGGEAERVQGSGWPDLSASSVWELKMLPGDRLLLSWMAENDGPLVMVEGQPQTGSLTPQVLLLDKDGNPAADTSGLQMELFGNRFTGNADQLFAVDSRGGVCAVPLSGALSSLNGQTLDGYQAGVLAADAAGNLYYPTDDGISRASAGGNLREVVLESGQYSFGDPMNGLEQLAVAENGDFYTALVGADGSSRLCRIRFDASLSSQPSGRLEVYSLYDSYTVRAAISAFRAVSPDTLVEWQPALDADALWEVTVTVAPGQTLRAGEVYATCPETPVILHRCMVPPDLSGTVEWTAENGSYTVNDTVVKLRDEKGVLHELTLCQRWPIRTPRPAARRMPATRPLVTGQRVIDTMFPMAKGGAAAIPGGFGTGKTMTQHQLAKWCDADIIIYVGCGERGNEMTQALTEFGEITDPKSGRPLTDRTVLIANTSNMPVAAREASIYTGITLAEYYRDMGYHTAMMADSTSRWAEALREISGRLEEMPADEGFPAYLPSRLAAFYERAGYVRTLAGAEGSVSVIGAVSPQGNDFSEPVTQNTKRFTRCFWALDKSLAYARHYPAINWNDSYSEYLGDLSEWYYDNVGPDFTACRSRLADLLLQENSLMQIVKLIGSDVLPDDQKLVIETARVIRVGFLQQNAFHADDTYVPLEKQCLMMKAILTLYQKAKQLVSASVPISGILQTGLFDKLVKMKYDIPNDRLDMFDSYLEEIDTALRAVVNA